ncbi:LysR family transcriptional regulator [Pseudomonas sp. SAICEU22]|jgi:DNA-binding transcriptional LysR family regulator|uniref:LysR family transcriptional regulator n=2 Tax=Pseudomonas TaxID=286 RepID=A0ABT3F2Z0_9PSED|nr:MULTISPECIES: LysR family transcriptional regulator [Pseudomonas]MBJ2345382.1 LysR family transcriptional regulator [Pseudomonas canavaninivorans]MBL3541472.1 LysR family transcriptional regulator [Pseudomonas sp. HB05]MCW1243439.1 LysR family transcriptional regulator [Pseudomonas agronomica]QXI51278.1 LysR family transcriptional regulator [Pseudomonas alvandae]UVM70206.1 LysR family transcriptional regulator [Pseudomonas canavaninivorans]
MNFDLADLRGFLAVADLGSFSAAAQALHLSQSALSRRVDKLELALGVQLFERTTRRVELSTIGRGFLPRARNVLNEVENALIGFHDLAYRLSGEVTIACVPSAVAYFLPDVIRQYHAKYPGIRVRVIDESSSAILTVVARGEADFGLTYIGTQDADVVFQPLLEESFVVALQVGHPLTERESLTWDDLTTVDYISLAQGSGNRFLIDQALANRDIRPRSFCEVKHVPALVSLVEAGLGVGVVPKLAMPAEGHATLVTRPLTNPAISRTLGLISRRGRTLSPVAQLLFDLLMGIGK